MSSFPFPSGEASTELRERLTAALEAALSAAGDDARLVIGGRLACDVAVRRLVARSLRDPAVAARVLDPGPDGHRILCRMLRDAVPHREAYDRAEHGYVTGIDKRIHSVNRIERLSTTDEEEAGRHVGTDLEKFRERAARRLGRGVLEALIVADAARGQQSNSTLKELGLSPWLAGGNRVKDQAVSPRSKTLPLSALTAPDHGVDGEDAPVAEDRLEGLADGRDPLRILSGRDELRERMAAAREKHDVTSQESRLVAAYGRMLAAVEAANARTAAGLRLMLELVPDEQQPDLWRPRRAPEVMDLLVERGFERADDNLPNSWWSRVLKPEPELAAYLDRTASAQQVTERWLLLRRLHAERGV